MKVIIITTKFIFQRELIVEKYEKRKLEIICSYFGENQIMYLIF